MSQIPEELFYAESHEWLKRESASTACIGITDHAQELLTDVVFVELTSVNTTVKKGEKIATLESVKAVSDVYAPVSGTITEVNSSLEDSPELLNSAPYTDGWIVKMELSDVHEVDDLLDAAAYNKHVEAEE